MLERLSPKREAQIRAYARGDGVIFPYGLQRLLDEIDALRAELAAAAREKSATGKWRTGGKVPLNVYEGDRPMFQCHTPEDAERVVSLLNAALRGKDQ